MVPDYWIRFLDENSLRDVECEIPENGDLSEMDGGCLEIYAEKDITEEASKYYPGIGVFNDGFIPVAACAHGSGDPYFININDGVGGPLYRIYHDEVVDGNYNKERAIDLVLNTYTDLVQFKCT